MSERSILSSLPSEARAGTHPATPPAPSLHDQAPTGYRSSRIDAAWVPDHVASRCRVSRLSGMTGGGVPTLRAYFLRLAVFFAAGLDFAAAFLSAVGFDFGP